MASCPKLTFVACSTLVCRPRSGRNRAPLLETIRRGRANPTRKRIFGGAWRLFARVRCRMRTHPCLLVRTDRVLFERGAGSYARCPSALGMFPEAKDTYSSSFTHSYAAMCAPEVVVRCGCVACAMRCALSDASKSKCTSGPVLGCTFESESDLGCSELV